MSCYLKLITYNVTYNVTYKNVSFIVILVLAFWIKVNKLFSPFTLIPQASEGVLTLRAEWCLKNMSLEGGLLLLRLFRPNNAFISAIWAANPTTRASSSWIIAFCRSTIATTAQGSRLHHSSNTSRFTVIQQYYTSPSLISRSTRRNKNSYLHMAP